MLLKLFVNCVGIIPIGSLVMLETSELAVVLKPAADKANGRTTARQSHHRSTGKLGRSRARGRPDRKDETGDFRHNIIRLIDNTEYKFDTSRYFI